jgi:hypothetical protein
MLWTTQPMYRWLGLLNLLYLIAAIVVRSTRSAVATDERERSGS